MRMIVPRFLFLAFTIIFICEVRSSDLTEPLLGRTASFVDLEAQVHGHGALSSSSSSSHSGTRIPRRTIIRPASPMKKTSEEIHIENAIKHEKEAEHHTFERLKWKEKANQANWRVSRAWNEAKAVVHADEKLKSLAKAKTEREKAKQAKQKAGSSRN